MSADPDPKETAWCAGFPQSGRRDLAPPETQELATQAVRLRRQAWVSMAAGPALFLFLLAIAAPRIASGHVPAGLALLLTLDLLLSPLAIILARDWLRRAAALLQDSEAGWVRQYAGRVEPGDSADEVRERLVRRRLLVPNPQLQQWFEVLPHSCRVWTANGRRTAVWIAAPPNLVANVPAYAVTAAEWVEPAQHPGAEGMHVNMRELSSAEIQELERHRRKLMLRPLVPAILFTFWTFMPLIMGNWRDTPLGMVIFGGCAAWWWLNFFKVVTLAGRVKRDAEGGRVVIVRRALPGAAALTAAEEFLPESGLPWSAGERPAPWRMKIGR